MTADELAALDRQLHAAEGWRPYLYDDATGKRITQGSTVIGHPTIGYGFNLDAIDLPQEAGDVWFGTIRTRTINEVFNALPWTQHLPMGPLRAVVDIAYNAGLDGLRGFHKMLAFAEAGNYPAAALEIIDSQLAPNRAKRLAALMRG